MINFTTILYYSKRITLCAFTIMVLVQNCFAQTQSDSLEVQLHIMDELTHEPLEYCTIQVYANDNIKNGGFTNKNGEWKFKHPLRNAIIFTCKISRIGYSNKDTVIKGQFSDMKYIISLKRNEERLKDVTVVSSNIKRDVDKLTFRVDHNKFNETSKATDVLKQVPLLNVSSTGDVSVKNNTNVAIYLNGKMASLDEIKNMPAVNIKTVEVVTNPSARYSAETDMSIVNIVLIKPNAPLFNGNATLITGAGKRYWFPGISLNYNSPKLYWSLSASSQISTQKLVSNSTQINDTTNQTLYTYRGSGLGKVNLSSVNTSAFYTLDSTQEISAQLSFSGLKVNANTNSLDNNLVNSISLNNSSSTAIKNYSFDGSMEYKKTFSLESNLIISYGHSYNHAQNDISLVSLNSLNQYSDNGFNNSAKASSNSGQVVYSNSLFNKKISIESGISYSHLNTPSTFNNIYFDTVSNSFKKDSLNSGEYNYRKETEAAFLSTEFTILKYDFRLGLRFERTEQRYKSVDSINGLKYIYTNFFPNVAIQKVISQNTSVLLNYKRTIALPDVSILSPFVYQYSNYESYQGNQHILPEFTNNFDIDADFRAKKAFYEVSVYDKYITNKITHLSSSSSYFISNSYANIKSLNAFGVSLSAKNNISDHLSINTNGFFEKYNFSKEYESTSNSLSGINYGVSTNITSDIPKLFSYGIEVHYSHKNYDYQYYTIKYPRMGVYIERNFFKDKFLAGLRWNNIFNLGNKSSTYFDDKNLRQNSFNNTIEYKLGITLSYSFGKYFFSFKSQKGIMQDGIKKSSIKD